MKNSLKLAVLAGFFALGIAGYYGLLKIRPAVLAIDVRPYHILEKPPQFPDISHFNTKEIAAQAPPFRKGKVVLESMKDFPEFSEFLEDDGARHLRLLQHRINPRAIVIIEGDYSFEKLYELVQAIDKDLIQKDGNMYVFHAPLLVAGNASLTISGDEVSELRLSKEKNAFLVNAGRLFILNTKVTGWDETSNTPAKFTNSADFRPFITSWDGSHLFIAGSRIESLGYLKGKSYGVSYSTCTECREKNPALKRPTGAIVESYFTDMLYGFYSFEADDVAVVKNTYADNVIYGIDPHDRSRRLIIAGNEIYGSKKKHGIILSREVNDSWIFGNHSHHNHGSGIMIDRSSVNNIIADNTINDNEQDGITFFESPDNTTWGNKIISNKKSGVRIRNSWGIRLNNDRLMMNDGAAVDLYTADIHGQESRDFMLDPFTQKADAAANGLQIQASGTSVFKIDRTAHLTLSDIQIASGTDLFPDTVHYDEKSLLNLLNKKNTVLSIAAAN